MQIFGLLIALVAILSFVVPFLLFSELEAIRDGKRSEVCRLIIALWLMLTIFLLFEACLVS